MEDFFIPVLIAAFTTLAIEYFAKPSLEKRKTRILEEFKLQRELANWIGRVNFQVGAWEFHFKEEVLPSRRDELYLLIQKSITEYPLENLSKELGLNKHTYNIVSKLLSSLEAWKKMIEYGANSELLDNFLVDTVLPLFDLAENAVNSSQIKWLPKNKLRKALRALSS